MTTRRAFLSAAALSVASATSYANAAVNADRKDERAAASVPPTLPPLPYAYDALEPYIDAETMKLHHTKHHQAYITGLIKAEEALANAREKNDFSLIQHWSRQAAFHGGGHYLHSLFWTIMAPKGSGGGQDPAGILNDAIIESFGSVKAFKAQFTAAATAVEGSGWALLHYRPSDQRLIVLQAENQHKLSSWGTVPILCLDVWEHAYYLKYRNDRGAYVNSWWNVVNWPQVLRNLEVAQF